VELLMAVLQLSQLFPMPTIKKYVTPPPKFVRLPVTVTRFVPKRVVPMISLEAQIVKPMVLATIALALLIVVPRMVVKSPVRLYVTLIPTFAKKKCVPKIKAKASPTLNPFRNVNPRRIR